MRLAALTGAHEQRPHVAVLEGGYNLATLLGLVRAALTGFAESA